MEPVDDSGTGAASPVASPPGAGGALSLTGIVRRSFGLSTVSVVGSVVAVPTSFLVARWLGPAAFGKAQFVLLFYFYATLLRTGTFEGGVRTYIDMVANGRTTEARRARDAAVSFETLAAVVPGLALVALAFVVHDPTRRLGFYLSPVAVVLASVSSYLGGLYQADSEFSVVARANLLRALVVPLLLLCGVPLVGASAVFIAPIIADAGVVALLARARPRLGLHVLFDRRIIRRLFGIGFPIGAAGVLYWGYRIAGSTSIAIWGSSASLGVYVFAAAPVGAMAAAVAALHAVLTPAVWTEMAPADSYIWVEDARRITVFLALLAGAITNLGQAGFGPVVRALLPHFDASVPLFEVLAFDVFLLSIAALPSIVLDSARVNQQRRNLLIWVLALTVNAVANGLVLLAGWGSIAVAANDVWIQATVVVALFWLARPHLGDRDGWRKPLRAVAVLGALTVLVAALLHALEGGRAIGSTVSFLGLRLSLVCGIWALVAYAYRHLMKLR